MFMSWYIDEVEVRCWVVLVMWLGVGLLVFVSFWLVVCIVLMVFMICLNIFVK